MRLVLFVIDRVFNLPSFSKQQVEDYIAEFDDHYHQLLTHLPYVAPDIARFKSTKDSVVFKDVRPDGNVVFSEHTEFEAAELFLVKARMFAQRPVTTWSLKNNTDLSGFCGALIIRCGTIIAAVAAVITVIIIV